MTDKDDIRWLQRLSNFNKTFRCSPSFGLGIYILQALAYYRCSGSWSFQDRIPTLELGNE